MFFQGFQGRKSVKDIQNFFYGETSIGKREKFRLNHSLVFVLS